MLEDPIARERRLLANRPAGHPPRMNVKAIISRQSLFRRTSPAAQADIAARVRMRCMRKGARLMSQRDPSDGLFILHRGRVKLYIHEDRGRSVTLAVLHPGEIFGENAALDGRERGVAAVALEEVTVLVLPRAELLAHLDRHPETAVPLLMELSKRMRQRTEIIASIGLRDVDARLARVLVDLARTDSPDREEVPIIHHRPTHRELAEMIGTRRETVSRALTQFTRKGWVTARGRSLRLSPHLLSMIV